MKYSFLLSGLIFTVSLAGCSKNNDEVIDEFVVPSDYKAYLSEYTSPGFGNCLYVYTNNKLTYMDQGGFSIGYTDTVIQQSGPISSSYRTFSRYRIYSDASGKPLSGRKDYGSGTFDTKSTYSSSDWDSIIYQYTNDRISSVIFLGKGWDTSGIYKLEYANGNLTKMIAETRGANKKTMWYEMTYGTEKGPFYDAVIPYIAIPDQLTKGYPIMIAYSRNALLTIQTTNVSDGGKPDLWTFGYQYNKYKYPAKVTAGSSTLVFTYK